MRICIFCGAGESKDPAVNEHVKKVMAHFNQYSVELVYGGASIGIMGNLANTLLNQGGKVIGVIPEDLMHREIAHHGLTELHITGDMHERKKIMYERSDAFLVFPGGMGTLDELFEILTWKQLGYHSKPIAILNINHFFDPLLKFLTNAEDSGLLKKDDRRLLFDSSSWEEIWQYFKEAVKE